MVIRLHLIRRPAPGGTGTYWLVGRRAQCRENRQYALTPSSSDRQTYSLGYAPPIMDRREPGGLRNQNRTATAYLVLSYNSVHMYGYRQRSRNYLKGNTCGCRLTGIFRHIRKGALVRLFRRRFGCAPSCVALGKALVDDIVCSHPSHSCQSVCSPGLGLLAGACPCLYLFWATVRATAALYRRCVLIGHRSTLLSAPSSTPVCAPNCGSPVAAVVVSSSGLSLAFRLRWPRDTAI